MGGVIVTSNSITIITIISTIIIRIILIIILIDRYKLQYYQLLRDHKLPTLNVTVQFFLNLETYSIAYTVCIDTRTVISIK